jgi:hypothetical protein
MLHEFLISHRQDVIERCRNLAIRRLRPRDVAGAIDNGVGLFLQQLIDTLRVEHSADGREGVEAIVPSSSSLRRSATLHGAEFLRLGYSVDHVVHEYGDICQSVTAVAVDHNATISASEFRTLNRCLDDAIADAVVSFAKASADSSDANAVTRDADWRAFSEEHEALLKIAIAAYSAISAGTVGPSGATGTLLAHTLSELRVVVERATVSNVRPATPATLETAADGTSA